MHNLFIRRALFCAMFIITSVNIFSQSTTKWTTAGNTISNTEFFGTLNNQPIIFYTNGTETMRLKPNGDLRINSLGGTGNNFVFSKSDGELYTKPFSSDTDRFLTEAGNFRTASSFTGWKMSGSTIHSVIGTFVGIGTNNPQYILDVNGTVRFNGTVNATGINITNKLQADTLKGVSLIRVNNTLEMTGGSLNNIYTTSGDLRLQSSVYGGNTLMNLSGGNVGVGMYTPQYKLDVNGDVRMSGKTYVNRLEPMPGDSVIRFGDSTIVIAPLRNGIFSTSSGLQRGLSLGFATYNAALNFYSYNTSAYGLHSVAIGNYVGTSGTAEGAIVIGGSTAINQGILTNTTASSLMVGFNSNIPTFFVSSSSGPNTVGKVGIGTSNPLGLFQVGEGTGMITQGPYIINGNTSCITFNAARQSDGTWITKSGYSNTNNGGCVITSDIGGSMNFIMLPSTGAGDQSLTDAQVQSNVKMQIHQSGRVIIGKDLNAGNPYNDPSVLLTVDGRVLCKDLVVTTANWPDYVFDAGYPLMNMDSLGQYVTVNKRLPATPPASQFEQNGASLSELCTAQQKQIEELTLYILQLNQRLEALEADKNATK